MKKIFLVICLLFISAISQAFVLTQGKDDFDELSGEVFLVQNKVTSGAFGHKEDNRLYVRRDSNDKEYIQIETEAYLGDTTYSKNYGLIRFKVQGVGDVVTLNTEMRKIGAHSVVFVKEEYDNVRLKELFEFMTMGDNVRVVIYKHDNSIHRLEYDIDNFAVLRGKIVKSK